MRLFGAKLWVKSLPRPQDDDDDDDDDNFQSGVAIQSAYVECSCRNLPLFSF